MGMILLHRNLLRRTSLLSKLLSITRNLVTPKRSKSIRAWTVNRQSTERPAAPVGFRKGQLRKYRRHRRRQQCSQYIMRDVLLHFKLPHSTTGDERMGVASPMVPIVCQQQWRDTMNSSNFSYSLSLSLSLSLSIFL